MDPNLLGFVAYLPAVILGTVAACFWLVALILFIRAVTSGSRGIRVQGRVVGHSDYLSRGRRMYSAIYEAMVPDGRVLQCSSGMATSWQTPPVGTVVTLAYRADDPRKPLVTLGFARFLLCTIFAGVAAVLTIPAVAILVSVSSTPSLPASLPPWAAGPVVSGDPGSAPQGDHMHLESDGMTKDVWQQGGWVSIPHPSHREYAYQGELGCAGQRFKTNVTTHVRLDIGYTAHKAFVIVEEDPYVLAKPPVVDGKSLVWDGHFTNAEGTARWYRLRFDCPLPPK